MSTVLCHVCSARIPGRLPHHDEPAICSACVLDPERAAYFAKAWAADRGFPESTGKIAAFLARYPDAEYGPAHVVLGDYNLEDRCIDDCIAEIEGMLSHPNMVKPFPGPDDVLFGRPIGELQATVAFLRELRAISEDERCFPDVRPQPEPFAYNINHSVRVRLTSKGREILHRTGPHDAKANPDSGGWSEFQLWDLMATFGPHLCMGCDLPFATDIVLIGDPARTAFEAAVARSKGAEG